MVIVELRNGIYYAIHGGGDLDWAIGYQWFYPSNWDWVVTRLAKLDMKLTNKWYHRQRVYNGLI